MWCLASPDESKGEGYKESIDFSRRPDWCPLVELPEKHGRLIDGDELWEEMTKYTDNEGAKMSFGENDNMICRDSILYAIELAPTIIPQSVDDTLNVYDQVLYRDKKGVITFITEEFCSVMYDDGPTDSWVKIDKVRKTGKSFPQFSELLKQMKSYEHQNGVSSETYLKPNTK